METKTNPINPLAAATELLMSSIHSGEEVATSHLSGYLEAHALIQNQSILDQLRAEASSESTPDRLAYSSLMVRALAVADRSRARFSRLGATLSPVDQPEREEARQFLSTELQHGDRPAREILALARSVGISPRTLKRAKAELSVQSVQRLAQDGNPASRTWYWHFPPAQEGQGATVPGF